MTKFIPMPEAPRTASPTPWLTSIHATKRRGEYGSANYRGNCGGYLIKDLLRYYGAKSVLDPMTGSGTCQDVCKELKIPCTSFDVKSGFDAANPNGYADLGQFDFIWTHPPYWKMIKYSDDPRCMSNAPTLGAFMQQMRRMIRNCRDSLTEKGKLAILIGGFSEKGRYQPLAQLTMAVAMEEGLLPACTEIIRLQYGNTSSKRVYERSFIPGLHDTCMVFENAR